MNIIPPLLINSPDYWCTWETQYGLARRTAEADTAMNEAISFAGDQGAIRARASLDENALFGNPDLVHQFGEVRGSLFLILDDGWDVDYSANPKNNRNQ